MVQSNDIRVYQNAVGYTDRQQRTPPNYVPFFARVTSTYSERMACDILTLDGQGMNNVPVMTDCGLVGEEPYGTVDLPAVGDYVVVSYASYGNGHAVILGTIIPYLANAFIADAVNSAEKTYTKKLLEPGKPLGYRKIFKSGATVQVDEDGKIIVETPDGTSIVMGGGAKVLTLTDSSGNVVEIAVAGITVTDSNANVVEMTSAGVEITDTNGNTFVMASSGVTINGNLEVLQ